MLELVRESKIKDSKGLKEEYHIEKNESLKYIRANVGTNKILKLIYNFVDR